VLRIITGKRDEIQSQQRPNYRRIASVNQHALRRENNWHEWVRMARMTALPITNAAAISVSCR